MSVMVQFIVENVPDVDHFVAVSKKWEPAMEADGARKQMIAVDENNPSTVSLISEWDSHDAMHASSEKSGEAFNTELGFGELNWITHIWHTK